MILETMSQSDKLGKPVKNNYKPINNSNCSSLDLFSLQPPEENNT